MANVSTRGCPALRAIAEPHRRRESCGLIRDRRADGRRDRPPASTSPRPAISQHLDRPPRRTVFIVRNAATGPGAGTAPDRRAPASSEPGSRPSGTTGSPDSPAAAETEATTEGSIDAHDQLTRPRSSARSASRPRRRSCSTSSSTRPGWSAGWAPPPTLEAAPLGAGFASTTTARTSHAGTLPGGRPAAATRGVHLGLGDARRPGPARCQHRRGDPHPGRR